MTNPQVALTALKNAQTKLNAIEKEISFAKYQGSASGISITINGRGDILSLSASQSYNTPEELAQAIVAAHKQAADTRERQYFAKAGSLASGKLPPGLNMPGISKIQESIYRVKEEVGAAKFAGSAAGNALKLVINGKDSWLDLTVNNELFAEGVEVVIALLKTAYKDATAQKDASIKEAFSRASSDILPMGMKIPQFMF
jgi:DNA-binding protein YbaB